MKKVSGFRCACPLLKAAQVHRIYSSTWMSRLGGWSGRGVKQAEQSVRPATKDNRSRLRGLLFNASLLARCFIGNQVWLPCWR
jgi:hypothetical protein